VLHLKEFLRGPLNVFADLMTVSRSIKKRPQNEHVQCSLQKAATLLRLLRHRRHSTLDAGDGRHSTVDCQGTYGAFSKARRQPHASCSIEACFPELLCGQSEVLIASSVPALDQKTRLRWTYEQDRQRRDILLPFLGAKIVCLLRRFRAIRASTGQLRIG
jgi:hypothetical protein